MKIKTLILISCLTSGFSAHADNPVSHSSSIAADSSVVSIYRASQPEKKSKRSIYLTYNSTSLSKGATEAQGLNDDAGMLELGVSLTAVTGFGVSLGIGFLNFDDNESFSNVVVDDSGFVKIEESEADAIPINAEVFYENPVSNNQRWQYRVGAGYTAITNANREIAQCNNCFSQDLEIDGGKYISASVVWRTLLKPRSSRFGLSYRQYLSGDLENSVMLWWQSR